MEAHAHHAMHPTRLRSCGEKGLKKNAIGFLDGAGHRDRLDGAGLLAGRGARRSSWSVVGVQAPAVLLASFVPMFLIASSFYYMNRADPDCGTTFSWITRAMGPSRAGSAAGRSCTTGIIVVGSLAAGGRLLHVRPAQSGHAARLDAWVTVFTVGVIALMTLDLRARHRAVRAAAAGDDPRRRSVALLLFAAVALIKVAGGDAPAGSIDPELSWFSPFAVDELPRAGARCC